MTLPQTSLQVREGSLKDLRRMAAEGRLFAILDACNQPAVPPKVTELGPERAVSLFRGQAEHEQWAIAPYLATADEGLVDWIAKSLWARPWGVFAVAECDLDALRKHFRRFLVVEDPQGETMYFRYYDPRILAAFLPACTAEELRTFFGPVKAYAVGDPKGEDAKFFLNVPA
jgi:hypothetical protein